MGSGKVGVSFATVAGTHRVTYKKILMLRALCFLFANLLVAWGLAKLLGQHLNYPLELPLRLRPELVGMAAAAVFSLLAWPAQRWVLKRRLPALLLAALLSIAASGALCLPVARLDGAQIALVVAAHSPLVVSAGLAWALLGSLVVYPPRKSAPPRPQPVLREPIPVAEEWLGSQR